ncbi:hypothetical protein Tco_1467785 [Tanacetum coccineum]
MVAEIPQTLEYKGGQLNAAPVLEDKEDVSFDDNEMTEVKVLMALANDESVAVGKESARNKEWVKISMKKFWANKLSLCKISADDTKASIPGVERPWLSESEGFTLPNHDTGRILLAESQVKITEPSVAITYSSATEYDSVDESSVFSTALPPLEKLAGAEPVSSPKTIKPILKSNSTFKAETLKGVTINEPS